MTQVSLSLEIMTRANMSTADRGLESKLKDGLILGRKHHQKDEFISRMLWSVLACAWPLRVWALVGWWVGGSKKAPQETDLTLSLIPFQQLGICPTLKL